MNSDISSRRAGVVLENRARLIHLFLVACGLISSWPALRLAAQTTDAPPRASLPAGSASKTGASTGEDEELQKVLSPHLTFEQQRSLFDLYVRLDKPRMAEILAERILSTKPDDKDTLSGLVAMYLKEKQTNRALETAKTLAKFHPADPQAQYYLGAAYYQAQEFAQAFGVFLQLKRNSDTNAPYPYQGDLASSALRAGHWSAAQREYRQLASAAGTKDDVRQAAEQVLEEIDREHRPELQLRESGALLDVGLILRTRAEYSQAVSERDRLAVQYSRTDIELEPSPSLRGGWYDLNEGSLQLSSAWNHRWATALWVGGTETGPLGGASVTATLGNRREVKLECSANEEAKDGLLLESAQGRQHRLTLQGAYLLAPHWLAYFQASGREVSVAHDHLGWGHGGNANFEYLWPAKARELHVGYRVIWQNFSRDTDDLALVNDLAASDATPSERALLLDELVLSWLHRQGGYLSWQHRLSPALEYHATAGADYAFELSTPVYYASGGIDFRLFKHFDLRAEGGYISNAPTADLSSAQWEFNVLLRRRF
jgi:tetratricopeptide (TPR) repeat protein